MSPSFSSLKTATINTTFESVGQVGGSAMVGQTWLILLS